MKILTSRYTQIGLALILAVLLITTFSSSASAASPVFHTVQPGQTLFSIAMYYGTSVWAISCANGLFNPNYVYAGQVLVIPQGPMNGCAPAQHPPASPPSGWHPPSQWLGCFYTVRWGDNLFRIALRYNIPWTVLAQANGLHNGNYIYAGQVLRVPCR